MTEDPAGARLSRPGAPRVDRTVVPENASASGPARGAAPGAIDELEAALVARLRTGDPAAFERAYQREKHAVHRFLVRLTGRPDLADDLFQETWLRLARSARRLTPDTRLRAWLFTVARNLHVSQLRRDATRRAGDESARTAPASRAPTPFEDAAAAEARGRLEAALAALPLAQREAVLLCSIERLDPAEAARVAGISAEAFRQRLARGRAQLRRALSPPSASPAPAAQEGGTP